MQYENDNSNTIMDVMVGKLWAGESNKRVNKQWLLDIGPAGNRWQTLWTVNGYGAARSGGSSSCRSGKQTASCKLSFHRL